MKLRGSFYGKAYPCLAPSARRHMCGMFPARRSLGPVGPYSLRTGLLCLDPSGRCDSAPVHEIIPRNLSHAVLAIAKRRDFLIYVIHGKTLFCLGEAVLGFWVRRPASELRQRSSDLQRSCRDPFQTDSADRIMHSDVRLLSDTSPQNAQNVAFQPIFLSRKAFKQAARLTLPGCRTFMPASPCTARVSADFTPGRGHSGICEGAGQVSYASAENFLSTFSAD